MGGKQLAITLSRNGAAASRRSRICELSVAVVGHLASQAALTSRGPSGSRLAKVILVFSGTWLGR